MSNNWGWYGMKSEDYFNQVEEEMERERLERARSIISKIEVGFMVCLWLTISAMMVEAIRMLSK